MKIEPAKNRQVDKQVDNRESRVNRNQNSVFNSLNQLKPADPLPAPAPGAFAKILDEARKQVGKEKAEFSTGNNDSSEPTSKTSKSDNEKEINRNAENKRIEEEENNRQESGESGGENRNDEENSLPAAALAGLQAGARAASENFAPAARAILHVADLERIVSAIRTQNFKDAQQVVIALKNSVLEGLQIRITISENGKLKAEFLALNEQIKKQLNLRKPELAAIFSNRSVRFSEIEVLEHQEWENDQKQLDKNTFSAENSPVDR